MSVVDDLRAAVRALRRSPGFVLAAAVALAVGIGATTAIFSVVDALLLRPMPYARGDALAVVWADVPQDRTLEMPPSYPDFVDWRAALVRPGGPLTGLAFARSHDQLLRGPESAVQVNTALVSDGFFGVLGGRPLLGRTLRPDDERPGAPRVVVLTYRLWREQFGGDPGIVGRPVSFAEGAATVVGVMPAGYEYPGRWAQAWAPLAPYAAAIRRSGPGSTAAICAPTRA
jgi:putative ABC transport system permease protein